MSAKTNFVKLQETIENFFKDNSQHIKVNPISLSEASKNDADKNNITYFYNGMELDVTDMDEIAKNPYKQLRVPEKGEATKDDIVNTTDGFIIDKHNQWFFIEFKDCELRGKNGSLKHGIIRKAYGNWYMLLDILYNLSKDKRCLDFNYDNPIKFAKENVVYILICSSSKNPNVVTQIRNQKYCNQKYTPIFMQRLKEYIFKDAYVYTEIEFERDFVKKFEY